MHIQLQSNSLSQVTPLLWSIEKSNFFSDSWSIALFYVLTHRIASQVQKYIWNKKCTRVSGIFDHLHTSHFTFLNGARTSAWPVPVARFCDILSSVQCWLLLLRFHFDWGRLGSPCRDHLHHPSSPSLHLITVPGIVCHHRKYEGL